jgi:hypothetical protein
MRLSGGNPVRCVDGGGPVAPTITIWAKLRYRGRAASLRDEIAGMKMFRPYLLLPPSR